MGLRRPGRRNHVRRGYARPVRWELPLTVFLVLGGVAVLVALETGQVRRAAEPPPAVGDVARSAAAPLQGALTRPALTAVEHLLETGTPGERAQAATILATTPMRESELLPLALRLLSDPEPRVRRDAARALLIASELSVEGITRLTGLLQDADEAVRSLAATALAREEVRGHPRAVDALLIAARDPVQDVRWTVLESLATHFRGRPAPILDTWVASLRDPCDDVKSIAANCIEGVGPAARSAADALEAAMLAARDPWLEWELSDALNAALGR